MKPALQDYIEKLVGGQFTVQLTNISVLTTVTKIVGANFERMALVLVNAGSFTMTMAPQMNVTLTTGIILGSAGGSASMNAHDDLALTGWEWFGLGNGGTTTVIAMEILRYNANAQPQIGP